MAFCLFWDLCSTELGKYSFFKVKNQLYQYLLATVWFHQLWWSMTWKMKINHFVSRMTNKRYFVLKRPLCVAYISTKWCNYQNWWWEIRNMFWLRLCVSLIILNNSSHERIASYFCIAPSMPCHEREWWQVRLQGACCTLQVKAVYVVDSCEGKSW